MTEMTVLNGGLPAVTPATSEDVQKMLAAMQNMAVLLRATNERLHELEAQVRRLEKITPAQATAISQAIRERAAQVCGTHRAAGCEKAAAAAIRKALKLTCGISNVRELPRADYGVAIMQIRMWDDFAVMRRLKAKRAAEEDI